uniref:Uncharacterized protein n=1 Tax=Oryza brachyantha TaxID=4533 RepID=J3LBD1_ORYBR
MSTAAGPVAAAAVAQRGGGCCSSGVTLELVGAFTAVCLVLYGVILYFNYLYVRWSGRDGVHRTEGGGAPGAGAGAGVSRAQVVIQTGSLKDCIIG